LSCVALLPALNPSDASAASPRYCVGGGFSIGLEDGTILAAPAGGRLRAVHDGPLGSTIAIRGRYISFDVDAATLGIRNFTFLPTDNPGDMTGGSPLVAWAAKNPDLRGGTLTSGLDVTLDTEVLEIARTGPFGSMKIQAKDCAQGGIFQMEPEAADGQPTVVTHILGAEAFYFDNPLFRARIGQVLNGVTVAARVNIASDAHPLFVARDSAPTACRTARRRTRSAAGSSSSASRPRFRPRPA
jgi:hypothetical protein